MKTTILREAGESAGRESKHPVHLAFAYGEGPGYAVAMRTCTRLAQQLRSQFAIHASWWDFASFQRRETLAAAARSAADADMIFVATDGWAELPTAAKTWIDLWLPGKIGSDAALVALLIKNGPEPVGTSPVEGYLKSVATSAKLDFFANAFEVSAEVSHCPASGNIASPSIFQSEWAALGSGSPRWGINE